MDVSKRGEEMLVSGSDDGHIGVSLGHVGEARNWSNSGDRCGTQEAKMP